MRHEFCVRYKRPSTYDPIDQVTRSAQGNFREFTLPACMQTLSSKEEAVWNETSQKMVALIKGILGDELIDLHSKQPLRYPIRLEEVRHGKVCLTLCEKKYVRQHFIHMNELLHPITGSLLRLDQITSADDIAAKIEKAIEVEESFLAKGVELERYNHQDQIALHAIFKDVVDEGLYFPYTDNSLEEFKKYFHNPKAFVYVLKKEGAVLGGFYLVSNQPGRGSHVANGVYLLKADCRGQGFGKHLVRASIELAKIHGFLAIQFNAVFSSNEVAIKIYRDEGFERIGVVKDGIRNADGTFQDSYIMYRSLKS